MSKKKANTCAPQNNDKKHRRLKKTKAALAGRIAEFDRLGWHDGPGPKGGHKKPGSMKHK